MDLRSVQAVPRLRGIPVLSGLLIQLLRRSALCAQGRLAANGAPVASADFPKLVSARIPLRFLDISTRLSLMYPTRRRDARLGGKPLMPIFQESREGVQAFCPELRSRAIALMAGLAVRPQEQLCVLERVRVSRTGGQGSQQGQRRGDSGTQSVHESIRSLPPLGVSHAHAYPQSL